jgi:hypothetical protein
MFPTVLIQVAAAIRAKWFFLITDIIKEPRYGNPYTVQVPAITTRTVDGRPLIVTSTDDDYMIAVTQDKSVCRICLPPTTDVDIAEQIVQVYRDSYIERDCAHDR